MSETETTVTLRNEAPRTLRAPLIAPDADAAPAPEPRAWFTGAIPGDTAAWKEKGKKLGMG